LDHTLFGLRTSHPTQKRLFLLSRKADLRSRSAHITCFYRYYAIICKKILGILASTQLARFLPSLTAAPRAFKFFACSATNKRVTSDHRVAGLSPAGCKSSTRAGWRTISALKYQRVSSFWCLSGAGKNQNLRGEGWQNIPSLGDYCAPQREGRGGVESIYGKPDVL
jgi:hypothetical protein